MTGSGCAAAGTGLLLLLATSPAAGQWAQGAPGRVWAKSALFVQIAEEQFEPDGDRVPWFAGGRSEAVAVFTDVIVGLTNRLDLWVQIPFYDLTFENASRELEPETGFGDLRAWLRYELVRFADRLPIAIRAGAKAPVGSSPLDGEIIPLGEGQWDLETFLEAGYSFWPAPLYVMTWVGWRARLENTTRQKDPGGEFVVLTQVGATIAERVLVKGGIDAFWSRDWVVEGLEVPGRNIVNVELGSGLRIAGPFWLEGAVRIPTSGQNLPAGVQWVAGVSGRIGG